MLCYTLFDRIRTAGVDEHVSGYARVCVSACVCVCVWGGVGWVGEYAVEETMSKDECSLPALGIN